MFPQESICIQSFSSLSWIQFLERVLLPETICWFISQDLNIDTDAAINVMKHSSEFGRNYHQDDKGYLIDKFMAGASS
jgi:hypothetical protein